jgi:hypothetical protein
MSLDEKVTTIESYDIPGEERCDFAYSCKRKCEGYILQDTCKRYHNHQKKKYQEMAIGNKNE